MPVNAVAVIVAVVVAMVIALAIVAAVGYVGAPLPAQLIWCSGVFLFGHAMWHVGPYFPYQGLNLCPLHWKFRGLNHWTTGKVPHLAFHNPHFTDSLQFQIDNIIVSDLVEK